MVRLASARIGSHVSVREWHSNGTPGVTAGHLGWNCCFAKEPDAPGCTRGPHARDEALEAALSQFSPSRLAAGVLDDVGAPAEAPQPAPAPAPPDARPPAGCLVHVVGPLDSLVGIALRYNTTPQAIVLANRLPSAFAFAAKKTLLIPGAAATPAVASGEGAVLAERTLAVRKLRSAARLRLNEAITPQEARLYLESTQGGADWPAALEKLAADVAWERAQGATRAHTLRRAGGALPPGAPEEEGIEDFLELPPSASAGEPLSALSALRQSLLGD